MNFSTLVLLLFSIIGAAGIAFYQYLYKANYKSNRNLFLAFLRFATIFWILLLLINPIITKKDYEIKKTPLPIVVDNSTSIAFLQQDKLLQKNLDAIVNNAALQNKYAITIYPFAGEVSNDTVNFKGKQTNIKAALDNLKQLYRTENYPLVLLSDGNQTQGNDYVFDVAPNATTYPVVYGDTIAHVDLKISQLNANKYAFLKNKFPVEVFLHYNGEKPISSTITIFSGKNKVLQQTVSFSKNNPSQNISVLLNADKVGIQSYRAVLSSSISEKNTYNNSKNFAVEVIDERTEIALVSSIMHPDLGAIKKAIESNAQRKVNIIKPQNISDLNKYNIFILYQPDTTFQSLLDNIIKVGVSTWTITGLNTDFQLLNQSQSAFEFKMVRQKEDYAAVLNENFTAFAIDDIGFETFPPLENAFGSIIPKENSNTLLQAKIRSVNTETPLLACTENGTRRNVYLFGENIWKWRMESYMKEKSFEKFDNFTNKIIQYLNTNSKKKNLIVNHEGFYNYGETISITAEYFNKNYELDANAQLSIQLKNKNTNAVKLYDFVKGFNDYQVDFQDLPAGDYSFIVTEKKSNTKYNGSFTIIDFDAEKQFSNADWQRLKQLAATSNGKAFTPNTIGGLIKSLLENEKYQNIQKEVITKVPLINWIWGLVILILLLATEWFSRKYYGML